MHVCRHTDDGSQDYHAGACCGAHLSASLLPRQPTQFLVFVFDVLRVYWIGNYMYICILYISSYAYTMRACMMSMFTIPVLYDPHVHVHVDEDLENIIYI